MKRKFLFLVCAVLGILQANAYTTDDLLSDGWSLVTSLENNKDYVYVFVDAGAQETAMVRGATPDARPRYNTLSNPIFNKQEVWVIEKYGDNYAILGIEDNYYFSTGDAGWNDSMTDGVDSNKGLFSFTLSGEKYDIRSVAVTGENNYMGPWNDEGSVDLTGSRASHDGTGGDGMEDIAVNKSYANAPGYRLYKMSKGIYLQKYLQQNPNLAAPVNVSYFILNSKIYQAYASDKMPDGWSEYNVNSSYRTDEYFSAGNNSKLKIWKSSNGRGDYYQTIAGLPNGLYSLTTSVRDKNNTGKVKPYIIPTGGSEESRKESADAASADESDRTTDYLAMAASPNNSVNVGMHTTSDVGKSTVTGDNFRLQVNPYLSTMATALSFPGSASLTAGLWYYYDIPAANTYDFTSSAAATIYYTQAADPLLDASTTPEAFTAGQTKAISLSAGRVYFKASEATTFSVEYRYNVGAATLSNANGSYTQSSTYSVTYPEAASNDPSASVALAASSKATVNGNEVALSAVTNGFSLDLGSLTANTDYHIVIPAGVYGYDGESMNAAIDVTIHTPAIFDGFYFLKTADNQYLSRGASWNTQAIADNTGLPLRVTTNANNITEFIFVDNWFHLFDADNGNLFTDNNTANNFQVQATTGGFYVLNKNTTEHSTYDGKLFNDSEDGNRVKVSTSNATVWLFEDATTSAHKTQMQAVKDAQAAGVAATAGITVSTQAALNTILSSNYNATPVAITGTGGTVEQNYQGGASNVTGNELAIFEEETVSGLTPGLYKLTVNAFERITWLDDVLSVGGASGLTYLYANDQKVRLCSLADTYKEGSAWSEGTPEDISKTEGYYVNNTTSAGVAFTAGHYLNEVFVYVTDEGDGTGSIRFGIKKPHRYGNDGSRGAWVCYNNFTLTRYEQTEVTMKTFKAGSYGTFIAPFDVTIPSGVTASKVTGHVGNLLTLEDLTTTIPKNTPVVVYSDDIINETFKGKDGSNGVTSYSEGLLTGIYTAASIAEGNYVLQTNGGVQGFYQVGAGGLTGVPYRAYLNSSALGVKAFFFGNDADGIDSVQGLGFKVQDSEIFNLAGQKMSKLQKGINIVNGKKVLVK